MDYFPTQITHTEHKIQVCVSNLTDDDDDCSINESGFQRSSEHSDSMCHRMSADLFGRHLHVCECLFISHILLVNSS